MTIAGIIAGLFGMAIITLGLQGFSKMGIALTRQRRLRGRVGQVIGSIVVVLGLGTLSKGISIVIADATVRADRERAVESERERVRQFRIEYERAADNHFRKVMEPHWKKLSQNEQLEIATLVANSLNLPLTDPLAEVENQADFTSACYRELQRREELQTQADAQQTLQQRTFDAEKEQRTARLDKAEADLRTVIAQLEIEGWDKKRRFGRLLKRAARIYEEAIVANALNSDQQRADMLFETAFEMIRGDLEAAPDDESSQILLVNFSASTLSRIGVELALPRIELAIEVATRLVEHRNAYDRRMAMASLLHDSAHLKIKADYADELIIADFHAAVEQSSRALEIAGTERESAVFNDIFRHYGCLADRLESTGRWNDLAAEAAKFRKHSHAAKALLVSVGMFARASDGLLGSAGNNVALGELETRAQDPTHLLDEAIATLQLAVDAGLERRQLGDVKLGSLKTDRRFQAIVNAMER